MLTAWQTMRYMVLTNYCRSCDKDAILILEETLVHRAYTNLKLYKTHIFDIKRIRRE